LTVTVAPAEAVAVMVPLAAPAQVTSVEVAVTVTAAGCVSVTDALAVVPNTSVTVTEYVPAERLINEEAVLPLDHR
jgi:hypothetical protein